MTEAARTEHDLIGDREVPAAAYWGIHTLRAVENFPITGQRIGETSDLIEALACIKQAAAEANAGLGLLDARRRDAIVAACREIRAGALHDQRVQAFVTELARRGLQAVDVSRLSGQVLEGLTHQRRHQELLDAVLLQVAKLLGEDHVQDTITEAIAREIKALKVVGLDQVAARLATRKVVVIVAKTIIDMAEDPQHRLRLRFDDSMVHFVDRLQHDEALRARGEQLRDAWLQHPAVAHYVHELWGELLAWLQSDLVRADSSIRQRISQAAQTLGKRLAADADLQSWINDELQRLAPQLIERYRGDIRRHIVERVAAWDAQEMTAELERHIGRDLQFIRINGTVVGGLVGLVIHALTRWWG